MKPVVWGVSLLCLLCSAGLSAVAADVSYYGVAKSIQYRQTNDLSPALLETNAYAFTAFVVASTNGVVTNATVKPSNTTPLRVLLADTNDLTWRFTEQFSSQTAMDAVYPTGSFLSLASYTMSMYGVNDGFQSGSLSFALLILPLSYPATPQLTNLVEGQSIDTTRDFELGWNSLGGSSLAVVQLTILDAVSNTVYVSALPFQPGALNGASFSAVIAANTLPPGTNLTGHLTIASPGSPNTNNYVGATGLATLAKDTEFTLATRPAPARPRLQILPSNPGMFAFRVNADPNRLYQVEFSEDLIHWTNRYSTNLTVGAFDYSELTTNLHGLYRAKVGQ